MPANQPAPIRLAQIGVGYWGRNLLRNFAAIDQADVVGACDTQEEARNAAAANHAGIYTTSDIQDVLNDDSVDAVVIATETPQHFLMAEAALRAGKHVFVEKPLAQTVAQAERLVALAEEKNLRLMVGHLLLYHPAFRHVEDLIQRGELGDIQYLYSTRVNLGIVRQRENAFESLAPHDLSVALAYINSQPVAIAAQGSAYLQKSIEDVVFATVFFENGALAHIHTSWLDPHKIRKTTVVGTKQMAVINDMEPSEKVRLYDKGAEVSNPDGYTGFAESVSVRSGSIVIPKIGNEEPLRRECEEFVASIVESRPPRTDGRSGLAVVRLLEAAKHSLEAGGTRIDV